MCATQALKLIFSEQMNEIRDSLKVVLKSVLKLITSLNTSIAHLNWESLQGDEKHSGKKSMKIQRYPDWAPSKCTHYLGVCRPFYSMSNLFSKKKY